MEKILFISEMIDSLRGVGMKLKNMADERS